MSRSHGRANPVLVEVTRGALVESRHRGAFAVVEPSGALVAAAGDIARPLLPRSAYKMLQALPLVASGAADAFGLDDGALALACASHSGGPDHVARIAAWLARLGLGVEDLACGPAPPLGEAEARAFQASGGTPDRLYHNCSGKHAGFLTLARHLGAPVAGYTGLDHPVQKAVRAAVAEACGVAPESLVAVRDGCGAPNFALPLVALARGLARFATGQGLRVELARAAARLSRAMTAHPDLVAGQGRICTEMMLASTGQALVKAGAEGVFAAALPEVGLGIAVKIDDGASRAAQTAIATLVGRFGAVGTELARWRAIAVTSADGVTVGHCRPTACLQGTA